MCARSGSYIMYSIDSLIYYFELCYRPDFYGYFSIACSVISIVPNNLSWDEEELRLCDKDQFIKPGHEIFNLTWLLD